MLENQARLRSGNCGIGRQVFEHELPNVLCIACRDVDEEVIGSTQDEELGDFRYLSEIISETSHEMPCARPKPNTNESLKRPAQSLRIYIHCETANYACRLQGLQAGQTGGRRDS